MSELPQPPVNSTDRNVHTSTGMFSGHITLPSSFLTGLLLIQAASFLVVIYWQFDQTTQIRARLNRQEEIVQGFLREKGVVIPPLASPIPFRK